MAFRILVEGTAPDKCLPRVYKMNSRYRDTVMHLKLICIISLVLFLKPNSPF